MKQNNYSKVQF